MRKSTTLCSIVLCSIVLLSALATAQVTVNSGYASYWTPPPGVYAAPFAPLVNTPSVDLGTPPLQVGASNATAGNVAGATSATLSLETAGPSATFALPAWYGQPIPSESEEKTAPAETAGTQTRERFDFGVATFQSDYGVARLVAEKTPRDRAQRVYTNDDIVRLDEANGMVKVGGKTERIE
jgi:hypothetical protein